MGHRARFFTGPELSEMQYKARRTMPEARDLHRPRLYSPWLLYYLEKVRNSCLNSFYGRTSLESHCACALLCECK